MRALDGAAINASVALGTPPWRVFLFIGNDKNPLLALPSPHRGFPEVIWGLRWVPQGGIGLRDAPPPREDEIRRQVAIERPKKSAHMPGRWATHYDACIDCGTTERPHRAHGRCNRCDDRWRYPNR